MIELTTEASKRRYRRLLDATLDELREKGLERTRIQEISHRSKIAIGTIYRYFQSREHLIYQATQDWVLKVSRQQLPNDPTLSLEDQMLRMVNTSATLLFEEPDLLRAWVRMLLSDDEHIVASVRTNRFADSLTIYPEQIVASEEVASDLALVMEHTWYASMVRWSLGEKEAGQVPADVSRAVRIVLKSHGLAELVPAH